MNITKIIALGALWIYASCAMQQQDYIDQLILAWQGKIETKKIVLPLSEKLDYDEARFDFYEKEEGKPFLGGISDFYKWVGIDFDASTCPRKEFKCLEYARASFDGYNVRMYDDGSITRHDYLFGDIGWCDPRYYFNEATKKIRCKILPSSSNGLIVTTYCKSDMRRGGPTCQIEVWSMHPFQCIARLPKEWKSCPPSLIRLAIDPDGKFVVALVSEKVEREQVLYVFRPDESDTLSKMIKASDCFFKFK